MMNPHHTVRVPASKAMAGYTLSVEITGLRTARLRLWLASLLIRVAALVAGIGCEVRES
jgi:hypothetical protein